MVGVLDGLKVVELGLFAVGPWSSKQLGAMGADVIKIEDPNGEPSHVIPPFLKGTAALYVSGNLNKRNVTLNLKDPAAQEQALQLLDTADVFIENMRPGAIGRLGLDYATVRARNPRVVYASASAYGSTGPMSTFAGADPFVQAYCGWCSTTGPVGTDGELLRYMAHLDITAASVLTEAILLGLVARERSGRGQRIEVDMLSAALSIQSTRLAEFFASGQQPAPQGSAAATTVPHQAFRCSDGEYVALGVVCDETWGRFCAAFGVEALDDPAFATNPARVENRATLIPLLEAQFATQPSVWWTRCLTAARVPNSRILDSDWVRTHPQVLANGHVQSLETPHWGRIDVEGLPWRFDGTPLGEQRPGGLKGEHNDEVLGAYVAREELVEGAVR